MLYKLTSAWPPTSPPHSLNCIIKTTELLIKGHSAQPLHLMHEENEAWINGFTTENQSLKEIKA